MDWNRTKSIFIVVFLILDIFLYSLYVNRYNDSQNLGVLGEKTIEARLKDDNITYVTLPSNIESAAYISGKVHNFTDADFKDMEQQVNYSDGSKAHVVFSKPVKLKDVSEDASFTEFVQTNIKEGASYSLWEVDREERVAIFFQKTNNRILYYNMNGVLKVHWNENDEVTMYEQTMIDNIEEMEQQESILPPLQIFQALYSKGLLKPDSRIMQMKLGYSTLVYLTKTQVLVPTWEVRVKLPDGEIEEYFVNAVEGKVIEIQEDKQEAEEEDWGV
ncbi:two-component system regulatory protein YycI [Lysinibacillus sp. NPDC097287]|uniref:two-component system regulatory protein YycI n=1 Tax=Lysinibacillus sp. NPDC097287 TaxID=3364144 RepID=UPI003809A1CC